MKDLLATLFRLTALLMLILCTIAVGVGRIYGPDPLARTPRASVPVSVNNESIRAGDRALRFLDPGRGRLVRVELPAGDALDRASVSPWEDRRHGAQVVGLWMGHSGRPGDLASRGCGLGRFTYPGGEPLDRIETEVLPSTPPCWIPGDAARVLFGAGDGRLYRLDFEADPGRSGASGIDPPTPLRWAVEGVDASRVYLSDPSWPTDPRFHDTILVSLALKESQPGGGVAFRPARVWWLRLDPARTAIVAAGLLTVSGDRDGTARSDRHPRAVATPTGGALLAYLSHPAGARASTLMVAPLRFEPDGDGPILSARPRAVADACCLSPPAFSEGGRSIVCLRSLGTAGGRVQVVDLDRPGAVLIASRRDARPTPPPGT